MFAFFFNRNRNTSDTEFMDKRVSPALQEGSINCMSSPKNLCDFMDVEPKPLIVANQSLISAPPNDAFDAVLKGGGKLLSLLVFIITRYF